MGCTLSDLAWAFLRRTAKHDSELFSQVLAREYRVYDVNHISTSYRVDHLRFRLDGHEVEPFIISLNTAARIGNDAIKLMARLHGQCECHAWVNGPERSWLADIMEKGLELMIYRENEGWDKVIELLRASDGDPVVTSYSVCDQFPNARIAGWQDDSDGDGWYELDDATQWSKAMKALWEEDEKYTYGRRLKPSNWQDYRFLGGQDAMQIAKEIGRLAAEKRKKEGSVW